MEPIRLALIGAGRRMRSVYFGLLPRLRSQFKIVAVCDPAEHAVREAADIMNAAAFRSLRELVRARPMEAALIVTPADSHHALSVFLSRHGIHHMCETPLAPRLWQAREMVREAEQHGVTLQVNEQFFRRDLIALWRQLLHAGVIGAPGRIVCMNGHLGYHTNSIFQHLAGSRPESVNAVAQAMPVQKYFDVARRWNETEVFESRFIRFQHGFCAQDSAANVKGALGRCPRPGYLEVAGACGALVEQPVGPWPWESRAEVRIVPAGGFETGGHTVSYPIQAVLELDGREVISERIPYKGPCKRLLVRLPDGEHVYENPTAQHGLLNNYLSSTALACLDFAAALREGRPLGYTAHDALDACEVDAAAALSLQQNGARVCLPVRPDTRDEIESLRSRTGVDPMDIEAMVDVAYPKNYVAAT